MSSILVDATQQIENMMRMVWGSVAVMCPVALRRCKALPNRSHAIRWMKEVALVSKMSTEARDTGIQILDKFLSISLAEKEDILLDTTYLSFAAAAAVLLSSKIHEGKSLLTVASFPHFNPEDLVAFERLMLAKIEYRVAPLCTACAFLHQFLALWPEKQDHAMLFERARSFIDEFLEEPESILFAPSTVAIAALLLTFSIVRIDASPWLQHIPDMCLPKPGNPLLAHDNGPVLLDIDRCLVHFQNIPLVRSHLKSPTTVHPASVSPTSVAGMEDCVSPVAGMEDYVSPADKVQPALLAPASQVSAVRSSLRMQHTQSLDLRAIEADDSDSTDAQPQPQHRGRSTAGQNLKDTSLDPTDLFQAGPAYSTSTFCPI